MAKPNGMFLILAAAGVGLAIALQPRKTGKGDRMPTMNEAQKLAALQPHVRDALGKLRAKLAGMGIKILIGQTRRTLEEEKANFDKGASATMNSWHMLGLAVDVYPYGPDGKPDLAGKHVDLFRVMQNEAKAFGFSGISFNSDGTQKFITVNKGTPREHKTWDGGHLQYMGGMTFAQAMTKYGTKGTVV